MNSVIVNLKAVVQLSYCVDARSRSRKGRLGVKLRRQWEAAGAFGEGHNLSEMNAESGTL
jgi:hypothetical protein